MDKSAKKNTKSVLFWKNASSEGWAGDSNLRIR